jgi:hypothetical protein
MKHEGTVNSGQSRATGNIGHKTQNNAKPNKKGQHRKLKRWATCTPSTEPSEKQSRIS